nr:hypothetical protein [Tanacetum cinerariifolium]GFA62982.1 hypothetical protein [Tanacetum cinerariifolium]
RFESLEQDKIAQALEITKLKQRVKRLEKKNKLKVFGLKRLRKVGTAQRVESSADNVSINSINAINEDDASKQGGIIALIDADENVLSMQDDEPEPAELKEVIEVVTIAKLMTQVVTAAATTITAATALITAATITAVPSAARRRKWVVIRDPKETATPSTIQAQIEKDEAYARELEAEMNKNINWALKRKSESSEEKAVKKQKEDLEVLWQIVQERFASSNPNNFLYDFLLTTLKAMFKKPDVEAHVWKNQIGIHGLAKVKSWRLLESCGVHIITFTTTQMILLVERRYPLTRFTLDQMLNNVRLEVKEESEVSLELLRFVRRQQQEGYRPE